MIADLVSALLVFGCTGTLAWGGWWWWLREQRLRRREAQRIAVEREQTERLRLELEAKVRLQESADRIYHELSDRLAPPTTPARSDPGRAGPAAAGRARR